MAEEEPPKPTAPVSVEPPAAEGGDEAAGPSKKALKKAEAKAKKEAEKARRAAERVATSAASGKGSAETEDLAKDNYGIAKDRKEKVQLSPEAAELHLKSIKEEDIGKSVVLRAWIQNSRMQG